MSADEIDCSGYFSGISSKSNKKRHITSDDICNILSEYKELNSKQDIKEAFKRFINETIEEKEITTKKIYDLRDAVVIITTISGDEIIECNGFFILQYYIIAPANVIFDSNEKLGQVYVTVFNHNEEAKILPAIIIGYDDRFNCCVLKINEELEPFSGNSLLTWGDSKKIKTGSKVTVIGSNNISENGIFPCIVSCGRYSDINGTIKGDLLLLDRDLNINIGSPIINHKGIVGMVIGKIEDKTIGLCEASIRRIVRGIVKSHVTNKIEEKYNFISNDSSHFCSKIGSIGINGRKVVTSDLIGTKFNVLVGYIVTEDNSFVKCGDLVTHINGKPIGDRIKQINPSIILSFTNIGDKLMLTYRKFEEQYEHSYNEEVTVIDINSTI